LFVSVCLILLVQAEQTSTIYQAKYQAQYQANRNSSRRIFKKQQANVCTHVCQAERRKLSGSELQRGSTVILAIVALWSFRRVSSREDQKQWPLFTVSLTMAAGATNHSAPLK